MLKTNNTVCGLDVKNLSRGSDKRVALVCDGCGVETETSYSNYYASQVRQNFSGQTFCRSCNNKRVGVSRRGRRGWNWGKKKPVELAQRSSYVTNDGYRMIFAPSGEFSARNWSDYKKEHVVVMEQFLGRPLEKKEVIHHIDGDKLNNELVNLLLTDHAGHKKAHWSLQSLSYRLVQLGLVEFDSDRFEYVANVKFRELLEQLEEANQQPSSVNDTYVAEKVQRLESEESTDNLSTSAEHQYEFIGGDIV